MPDVVRSDSQRSDTSLRPRVSFNRDVHVKRIVPREDRTTKDVDESNYSSVPSIRKQRKWRSRKEFFEGPSQITQSDKYSNLNPRASSEEKFYTLPRARKQNKEIDKALTSLDRRQLVRKELDVKHTKTSKKPQGSQTLVYKDQSDIGSTALNLTKKSLKHNKPPKKKLTRSISDAENKRSKNYDGLIDKNHIYDDQKHSNSLRYQLSPIVEQTSHNDNFSSVTDGNNKENDKNNLTVNNRKTKHLKEYVYRDDQLLSNENKSKCYSNKKNEKKIIVIDIDKAENISKSKESKLKNSLLGRKLKLITKKKNKQSNDTKFVAKTIEEEKPHSLEPSLRIKQINNNSKDPIHLRQKMIHSSQKPSEKLPLTRGRTVDVIVRRLNNDTSSPPPRSNRMVIPNQFNQHNNNQPFSYTRGLSPEKYMSDENITSSSEIPVIYAHVVCNNDHTGFAKQTVHTTYSKKYSHSDSDEGLGNEETSGLIRSKHGSQKMLTHFGDDVQIKRENAKIVTRNDVLHIPSYDSNKFFIECCQRGCGDGMESKKNEGSVEKLKNEKETDELDSVRNSLSIRRDLLESRITRKIHDKIGTESKFENSVSSSPSPLVAERQNRNYSNELERSASNYCYSTDEPKSFDSYISDVNKPYFENKEKNSHTEYKMKHKTIFLKDLCKSTPDIYRHSNEPQNNQYVFHDSLQRDKYKRSKLRTYKNKFSDSGIEHDIECDAAINLLSKKNQLYNSDNHIESEDEGFASSLLIASEKQHTEDNINKIFPRKEYDSDMTFFGEDDPYHHLEDMDYKEFKSYNDEYLPRERSIDDGSHFDPRIDKEVMKEQLTLKRNEKKPPKPEKKSSLEKMKKLFTRDNKKKKVKQEMVREESLLARYSVYKGNEAHFEQKHLEPEETSKDCYYGTRKRLPTPSPNSSPVQEVPNVKKNSNSYTNWFKSLERISRNTKKKEGKRVNETDDKLLETIDKHVSSKNLRFFGDTDSDSGDNVRKKLISKPQMAEEIDNPELGKRKTGHKSMLNISNIVKEHTQSNQKPPIFPSSKSTHDVPKSRDNRRKKYEPSSVESSTEGESQQSQRSIVYLHAARVGDIPGPTSVKYGQKAVSKEELATNDSNRIQPQTKTLSRSFSVLAPWKPRYSHQDRYIDYSQDTNIIDRSTRKDNISSSKVKDQNTSHKNGSLTLNRNFKGKDNLSKVSKKEVPQKTSTLYKKKERIPREHLRYNKDKEEKKNSVKSHSVESLRNIGRKNKLEENTRNVSRSVSMPKDPVKLAGWYKNNRKDHPKSERIVQRI